MTPEPMVHIVDDDSAVRDSLREMVESAGLHAALYASAEQYLETCQAAAGCLILDIRMAELSGLDLLPILRDRTCDLPTIVLSGHGDVPAVTCAFKQGAVDFIQKPFNPPELLRSVRAAMEQDRRARQRRTIQSEVAARIAKLSAREREVMDLIVLGLANKQVAARLGIAERTVEDHRSRVMRTMEVDSVAQLVRMTAASGD